ncbi:hypothetical protein F5Y14DRAFT_463867 [Nemania sp. NC0429]|nr:hypothetical protein F5Y14DRAFT_463867 [Nemania sp. NC0429]
MAGVAMTIAYDMSHMVDSIYKVPINDDGLLDYAGAINLAPKGIIVPSYTPTSLDLPPRPTDGITAALRGDSPGTNNNEDIKNEDGKHGLDDVDDLGLPPLELGTSHCHRHFPHHHTRFIMGNQTMDFATYPLTLAMFITWMETGADLGWVNAEEMIITKTQNTVVGACIFKSQRRLTCVHELALAMKAADHECAQGRVGCHVCVKHWHKGYFRLAATEAPEQCECAAYYW